MTILAIIWFLSFAGSLIFWGRFKNVPSDIFTVVFLSLIPIVNTFFTLLYLLERKE